MLWLYGVLLVTGIGIGVGAGLLWSRLAGEYATGWEGGYTTSQEERIAFGSMVAELTRVNGALRAEIEELRRSPCACAAESTA